MKLEFCRQIFEKIQIQNCMQIRPLGGDLFHADGDMTKLIVALRNSATAPKKDFLLLSIKAGLTLWPVHFGRGEER